MSSFTNRQHSKITITYPKKQGQSPKIIIISSNPANQLAQDRFRSLASLFIWPEELLMEGKRGIRPSISGDISSDFPHEIISTAAKYRLAFLKNQRKSKRKRKPTVYQNQSAFRIESVSKINGPKKKGRRRFLTSAADPCL